MTPEQAAAAAMREKAAQIFEEETETYNEGLSAVDVRLSYTRALKWPSGHKIAAAIRAIPLPEAKDDPRGSGQREANPTVSVSAACSQTQDYALNAEGSGRVCSVDPRDKALELAREALRLTANAPDNPQERLTDAVLRAGAIGAALAAIETAQKGCEP